MVIRNYQTSLVVTVELIVFFTRKMTGLTFQYWGNVCYAQNPLHTFPRNFPVDRETADLLQQVGNKSL